MTNVKTAAVAVILVAAGAATASAAPLGAFAPLAPTRTETTPVVNGYGPNPYGIYGSKHRSKMHRSYGTGYHGRGTATGGPVGGLPNRN